ncbi:Polyketide cyclase / dehydrase and lipid transport protein [Perilla frutescens var. hirtella]|uniref:Polyketide cyclase / dehydrase and lipid transport protein n=1 Tax=Perilla frutescens var. hirtella TaxID=608512 RepID=A0AAD4P6E9_PERFH|nr:Polyketide cyclase / dehydrase and lipid transport protein [Perilla frutescens var. hirtella]
MTSVLYTAATLPCASTNSIPKLSSAKSLSNSTCSNPIGCFTVLDAESEFLAKILRKLKPYGLSTVRFFQQKRPLVVCLSHFVSRAYVQGDSGYTSDSEGDGGDGKPTKEDTDDLPPDSESQDNNIKIEIEKTSQNSRRIRSKVGVQASLQTVWDILTDYERLADFIPGLAVSQLLEKRDNFARLFQIGEQDLAFGLKFNAKGTIDCLEKDLEIFPFGQKRDIEFKMVEGDFQLFEGKWSVEQEVKYNAGELRSDSVVGQEFQTTLVYVVHVKPKVWLPVGLVEGRLCKEIRTNLSCIREEAEKAFQNANSVVIED